MPGHPHFKYIAFYDLDHTVFTGNSATFLVNEAVKRKIMSQRKFRHAIYLSLLYKMRLGDPVKIIRRMLTWLEGLNQEMIRQLCREVFHHSLQETIRPEILEVIDHHRRNGGANVLLSSATEPICKPVSDHLALDDMICTYLGEEGGLLTGTIDGNLVYGIEKRHRMLSYCSDHGYDPGTAYYYGDSHTDRHVMESTGNPVAVSPDKKLLNIARKKGWPILVQDR
jgi:putative phosphoserine phosphatase / 1-acylglycerol-3-phosphate O-acyltransferase